MSHNSGLPKRHAPAVANPGAPFRPEVLEAIGELKPENRAAFEILRPRSSSASVPDFPLKLSFGPFTGTLNNLLLALPFNTVARVPAGIAGCST